MTKYAKHYNDAKTVKTCKKGSSRYRREPWMTDEILTDMRKRDRLAKIKNRRSEYQKLSNETVARTRKVQKQYIQEQIKDSMGDIKRHWTVIKQVTNKTNNKDETTTGFYHAGRWVEDNQENADHFNDFYAKIGKGTNQSVGPSTHNAKHYLKKHVSINQNSILLNDIIADDVTDACKKFKLKTSKDPLGFQQNIVLSDIHILAPVVAHLINCSQREGIFPENAKIARVIPIYKNKGSKQMYENYRPISLLPIFSKIIERLIYNKVFEFLVRYEIIFDSQYGFRRGHNTTHATLDFLRSVEDAIEMNEHAIEIFCDLSKAFDTLNHKILISKLEHYGIRRKALNWVESYLKDRKQYTEWGNCKSSLLALETGVPQGSILGPLLFLIYINDLPSATNLKSVMYADDTNLLVRGKNLENVVRELNRELENINDYFKANQLKLNPHKTKMVYFSKTLTHPQNTDEDVTLDGVKLKYDEYAPFLGIQIDSQLNWDKHCIKVANTILRNNSVINRVKKLLPPSSLKLLYNSFIQPHLQYGLPVWGGCSGQNKNRIVTIQKRAIRTITKSYYSSHTEPRIKKIALLKFEDLYKQQCLMLTHDCINNNAPNEIRQFVKKEQEVSRFNLRAHVQEPLKLRVPAYKTRCGRNSYRYKGPNMWNEIPSETKEIARKSIFKNAVKRQMLQGYQLKTTCNNPRCTDKQHH